ncbi:linker histone H1 and H5 family-domain-containing protein [Parasitella parasitica]|nr:linker histone H1 and H5 family-domain-containing protein [Parasitella parasitica]
MTNAETKLKAKKLAEHPSYESMIIAAVSNLKERKGSSRPAIKKYILANFKVSPGAHFDSQISGAIRRGTAKNVFSLPKGLSGTIKLVKPEKKGSAPAEKKTDGAGKKAKVPAEKKTVAPVKKSTTSLSKKAVPIKKTAKSPAKKVVKKKVSPASKA